MRTTADAPPRAIPVALTRGPRAVVLLLALVGAVALLSIAVGTRTIGPAARCADPSWPRAAGA